MKIKTDNYAGLLLYRLQRKSPEMYAKVFADGLLRTHMDDPEYMGHLTPEQREYRKRTMSELLYKSDYKLYLITEAICEREIMRIKNPMKGIRLLGNIPVKRGLFVMNKQEWFKYYVDGDDMYFVWMMYKNDIEVTYSAFHIRFSDGYVGGITSEGLRWTVENFLRVLIYVFYSKREFVFVKPSEKHKGRTFNDHVLNATDFPITYVDTNWNKTIIRVDGFDVQGFFRFQACGKQWSERELIWVDGFRKHHYIRRARVSDEGNGQ